MLITNHAPNWYQCTGKLNGKRISGYGRTALEAYLSALKDYQVVINLY